MSDTVKCNRMVLKNVNVNVNVDVNVNISGPTQKLSENIICLPGKERAC
jgi:hypothetical protein